MGNLLHLVMMFTMYAEEDIILKMIPAKLIRPTPARMELLRGLSEDSLMSQLMRQTGPGAFKVRFY